MNPRSIGLKFTILMAVGMTVLMSCSKDSSPQSPASDPPPFVVTTLKYTELDSIDAAVKAEYGAQYRLADWDDVKGYCSAKGATSFVESLRWCPPPDTELMVSCGGQRFACGPRHYFIAMNNHYTPSNFLVYDHIENHLIDLGSWYGLSMRVLGVRN